VKWTTSSMMNKSKLYCWGWDKNNKQILWFSVHYISSSYCLLAIDNDFLIIGEKRSLISFNSIFLQRLLNLKFRTPLFLRPLPFETIPSRLKERDFHSPSRKWMSSFACSLHSSSYFLVVVGGTYNYISSTTCLKS
jgi:hypothetical protein